MPKVLYRNRKDNSERVVEVDQFYYDIYKKCYEEDGKISKCFSDSTSDIVSLIPEQFTEEIS